MITLNEIVSLQHKSLGTLSSKVVYLMIRNKSKDKNWVSISLLDFHRATGMAINSLARLLKRLQEVGLIERNPHKEKTNDTNQYRSIAI